MRSANAIALIHPYAPANYVVACQFQSEKTFAFTRVRWLLISTTLAEHKMTKGFALTFAVLRGSTKDDDSRIIQWSLFGLKQVKCGSIFHIRMLNTHSLCQQLACELSWFSHSPPFWCDSIQHTSIKPNGLQQTKQWWTEFERFSIKVERCYIRFVDRGLFDSSTIESMSISRDMECISIDWRQLANSDHFMPQRTLDSSTSHLFMCTPFESFLFSFFFLLSRLEF